MSTLVTNELFAKPGRGDDVASLLLEILGESLQHEGCETIRIVRGPRRPGSRRRVCELCEHGTTVAVHQVAALRHLGMPGPGQPAWAALMARMRRKTLIVCVPCHEHIHASPVAHAA